MAKPEWGVKRVCQSCSAKFYDLQRNPITCPKCGANFDPDALLKSRRPRPAAAKAAPKDAKKPVKAVEDDVLLDEDSDEDIESTEDDGDDAVLANTDDLGDDSDLADVVIESDKEES